MQTLPSGSVYRPSQPKDSAPIEELLKLAFAPSRYEVLLRSALVRDLSSGSVHEWVLLDENSELLAHALFSPAFRESEIIGLHLAPLSVSPAHQGQGIGSSFLHHLLHTPELKDLSIFVLGSPPFYRRLGFQHTTSARCPFDPENQHFLALRWAEQKEPFEIGYHPAFTAETEE